ncbi:hypothetical protein BJ165DRAFT_576244 [Panaeolus papilionaceus]|nr:hypothetical protein BJ165DRAFT_576244 [Panaeolus papilionaceus]
MPINHDIIPHFPFPTLDRLGVDPSSQFIDQAVLTTVTAQDITRGWLDSFSKAAQRNDSHGILDLILDDGWWRDMLAFTWDFRTFHKKDEIGPFLSDRLTITKPTNFTLNTDTVSVDRPAPNMLWISLSFTFETAVGHGSSITRLMPTPNGTWKAHTVFTNLEGLAGFPEKIGPLRSFAPNHGKWEAARLREREFVDKDPQVLILGAGQSGLEVAARLKALDVSVLVVDKNERIGDNWRKRYEALCLHDPVWYDHMPYLPFPPNWPVYTPALKLANWLEFYADSLELNVWTSSTITSIKQDPQTNKWDVAIKRTKVVDGKEVEEERKMTVSHIVMATGLGSGVPNTPKYPGMDVFRGQILHSTQHKKATDHAGKKVVIVGACTSAHDIAVDYYEHNIDVTMFQHGSGSTYIMSCKNGWEVIMKGIYWEDGPSPDYADRLNASFPHHMATELNQMRTKVIAEMDKDIIEGLKKVGFKMNLGIKDTGFGLLAWTKAGGYYLDTGGSQLIADGKIKLKATGEISSFTEKGIKFDDGSELEADVVVFATGLGDPKDQIVRIAGPEIASKTKPIWGLDEEGELNGVWRDLGVPGLWSMMGNLALCRFHSTHVTLQIKAMLEGVFGERYSRK